MSRHNGPAQTIDLGNQPVGIETGRQRSHVAVDQKVALGRGILHAHYDQEPVSLEIFRYVRLGFHGIVIRNADPVEAARPGRGKDFLQGEPAA
jgi:hypothetical protein